jgi:tetrahydromethanopterin S-methyltransferase subunit B
MTVGSALYIEKMNNKLSNDERAAIGHWAVLLTNRVNEIEQRITELEETLDNIGHTMDAATYLLKTFMDAGHEYKTGDN